MPISSEPSAESLGSEMRGLWNIIQATIHMLINCGPELSAEVFFNVCLYMFYGYSAWHKALACLNRGPRS